MIDSRIDLNCSLSNVQQSKERRNSLVSSTVMFWDGELLRVNSIITADKFTFGRMTLKNPSTLCSPGALTYLSALRAACSGLFGSYIMVHLIPAANLEILLVTRWSMEKDTPPSATALFLAIDSRSEWDKRNKTVHIRVTLWTTDHQTAWV